MKQLFRDSRSVADMIGKNCNQPDRDRQSSNRAAEVSGRNRLGTAVFAKLWIAGSVLLAAQQVPGGMPAPQEPDFRVTVNLAQVEVVVTGADGHPVRDLEPADFSIREDGVRQKITHFSWIQVSPPRPDQAKPVARPRKTLTAPATPGRQDVHRTIVLMLDDGGTSVEDLVPVISAARQFVQEQIEPGDLVAVTASRGGMGFYQQFTSDRRQLLSAVDRIGNRPCWGQFNLSVPRGGTTDTGEPIPAFTMAAGEPALGCRNPVPNPIGYLAWSIQGLQHTPGRKAIFLFTGSPSFPAPPGLIDAANRAGVTIHVIDPGGATASVTPGNSPSRRLAQQTGGLWTKSAPCCLAATMGRLVEEMSGYYLIGYQPDRSRVRAIPGRSIRPAVEVKVTRKGLTARFKAVSTDPAGQAERPAPRTREESLQNALWSPFSAGAVQVQLTPLYSASAPDDRSKRRNPVLRTVLAIDGRRFEFTDTAGGEKQLILDIVVALFTPEGESAGVRDQRFTIVASPARARQLSAAGVSYTLEIPLKGPGPYQVRAAVVILEARPGKDDGQAVAGSAYEFVEIPDFNKPRIALSSIVLSQPDGEPNSGRGVWREFDAGTVVDYSCGVFGATMDPATRKQNVELEARLFRQDQLVWASQPLAVSVDPDSPKPAVTGSIPLSGGLEAGEYSLELVATDRANRVALQWTALTVIRNQ